MNRGKKAGLVQGENRKENIRRCLNLIRQDLEPIKNAKRILIKPNLVALQPDYATTHVEAIEAVIEFVREIVPDTPITVGEASAAAFYRGLPTRRVFEDFDYYRLTDFDQDREFIQIPKHTTLRLPPSALRIWQGW